MSTADQPLSPYHYTPTEPLSPTLEVVDAQSPEAIRRQYLNHERSLKTIGILQILGSLSLIVSGALMLFALFASLFTQASASSPPSGEPILGSLAASGAILLMGAALMGTGINLRRLKRSALIPARIFAFIGLLGFPIGTLLNVIFLISLFSGKNAVVMSAEYKDIIQQTPHVRPQTSLLVKVVLILILGAVALVIGGAIGDSFF